jgi:hypothetical protein
MQQLKLNEYLETIQILFEPMATSKVHWFNGDVKIIPIPKSFWNYWEVNKEELKSLGYFVKKSKTSVMWQLGKKILESEIKKEPIIEVKEKPKVLSKEILQIIEDSFLYDYQKPHCIKLMKSLFKNRMYLDSSDTGTGKCHGKGTEIIMYDGTIKKVEEIKVGDLIMGDDSTPRKVLSLANGIDDLYEVIPIKYGNKFVCNKEHILCLSQYERINGQYQISDKILEIPIKKYIKLTKTQKHYLKLYRNKIKFESQPVLIDPYFLGLWLADGTKSNTQITTPDKEIIEYLSNYSKKLGMKLTKNEFKNNKSDGYSITSIKGRNNLILNHLRHYNLLNNKHIPKQYISNSEKIRKDLLAGLLDGDGYKYNNGGYEIIQKRKSLAEQIVFLARSLGYSVSIRSKKSKGFGIEGTYYRINLSNVHDLPIRIERKKTTESRKQKKRSNVSGFTINYLGKGEYFGFQIDGNHRYLLSDTTVTHNTFVSLFLCKALDLVPFIICPKSVVSSWKRSIDEIGLKKFHIANYGLLRSGKELNWVVMARGKYKGKIRRKKKPLPWITLRKIDYLKEYKRKKKGYEPKYEITWNLSKELLKKVVFIYDEGHRCKNKSINSEIMIELKNINAQIGILTATLGESPLKMVGTARVMDFYEEGWEFYLKFASIYGCFKGNYCWEFDKYQGKTYMKAIYDRLVDEERMSRMKVKELIDQGKFPESKIISEAYEMNGATNDINESISNMVRDLNDFDNLSEEIKELKKEAKQMENPSEDILDKIKELKAKQQELKSPLAIRQKYRQMIELAKIPTVIELAQDEIASGNSVVILMNYIESIKTLAEELKTDCLYYGQNKSDVNEENRLKFERNESHVIIGNVASMKEGIDLHDKNHERMRVSLISPSDSAQNLKQSLGRVHRSGGTYSIQKIIFASGTIEEMIAENVKRKIENISILNDGDIDYKFI